MGWCDSVCFHQRPVSGEVVEGISELGRELVLKALWFLPGPFSKYLLSIYCMEGNLSFGGVYKNEWNKDFILNRLLLL